MEPGLAVLRDIQALSPCVVRLSGAKRMHKLLRRAENLRATFTDESVRAEKAYIVSTSDGPILVYAIEAEDFQRGAKAYASSSHAIDAQHVYPRRT